MTAPLPILALDDFQGIGGAQTVLLKQLAGLDRNHYRPHVVVPGPGRLSMMYGEKDVSVHHVDLAGLKKTYLGAVPLIQAWRMLHRIVRQERIGIIHANSLWTAMIAAPVAMREKCPMLTSVHAFPIIRTPLKHALFRLFRSMVRRATDRFVAVSNTLAEMLIEQGICRQEQVVVLHNGVDLDEFSPSPVVSGRRSAWGIPATAPVVGTAGRIHPGKGQGDFLEAAGWLHRHDREAWYVIIGEEIETPLEHLGFTDKLKATAERLGIGDRVLLPGFQENMVAAYGSLDVLVLPSHEETFGMVALEAMAMGLPVVATRVGGVPELVTHERTGLLVPAHDVQALAGAIDRLLADEELREGMGRRGRAAAAQFDIRRHIVLLQQLYDEVSARVY
ncbi:glycosyltransferase family 4 protein [bacterium]|nr:glycosyltransferase family 4 protein [candidate division CSSED10-310 bacterium]